MTTNETNGAALIAVDGLTKRYGDVVALNDISFQITDGITGILGENGAGKSTAIKILLGLLQPTSGSAMILGQNASETVAARARVGYMVDAAGSVVVTRTGVKNTESWPGWWMMQPWSP